MNERVAGHVFVEAQPAVDAAAAVGARLAALYGAVGERSMRDLPVYNAALGVEAVGFRRDGGRIVGVVATPWFMNLVVTGDPEGAPLPPAAPGASVTHAFPGGDFSCVVGEIEGFGRLDSASLFSPMFEFDDPAVVRAVAVSVMEQVLTAPEPEAPPKSDAPAGLDRRALLFGRRGREDEPCR